MVEATEPEPKHHDSNREVPMKFRTTIRRVLPWLSLFNEQDVGYDNDDGAEDIGVRVPGLLKTDGSANPKGNVLARLPVSEAGDLMATLRTGKRRMTASEVALATLTTEDGVVSFKVSDESGARQIKVPEADWPAFLDAFEEKLEQATGLLQVAQEANAQAAAESSGE